MNRAIAETTLTRSEDEAGFDPRESASAAQRTCCVGAVRRVTQFLVSASLLTGDAAAVEEDSRQGDWWHMRIDHGMAHGPSRRGQR
ncbi:hypothetical protein HYQ46_008982 [Verticillium longisporum]|nr:hypothetical protein HYQ46_008982 [Verticillium longisporum]